MPDSAFQIEDLVQRELDAHQKELETELDADVLTFIGQIVFGVDEELRKLIESLKEKRLKLAVVLDTPGGIVEVVERMVDTIRHHYRDVSFIVPDRAMSAGTVFALSGDAIWMDYFSVLGPIDPQVEKEDGHLFPALAYLVQFERLVKKSAQGQLTTAELVLLEKLDLGELQRFEEARQLSIDLLQKWLLQYKFKDWTVTKTNKTPVTEAMKQNRAKEIAEALSDHQRWHSHARGIPMKELRSENLRLQIDDFGENESLATKIKQYFSIAQEFRRAKKAEHFLSVRDKQFFE